MSNKVIALITIVLVAILGYLFWRSWAVEPAILDTELEQIFTLKSLTVDHYFRDGVHTLEGTIKLPTPCHEVSHEVIIAKSLPEQVSINFSTKKTAEICTQVIADKFFSVSFEASEEARINASMNGVPFDLIFGQDFEGVTK